MIQFLLRCAIVFSLASSSYAEVKIAEPTYPIHSLINPRIAALPVPLTPKGMSVTEFGLQVIGWGIGAEAARHRMDHLDSDDVETIKQQGTSLEMVRAWQTYYENETIRNLSNPAAKSRARLLKKIAELW